MASSYFCKLIKLMEDNKKVYSSNVMLLVINIFRTWMANYGEDFPPNI